MGSYSTCLLIFFRLLKVFPSLRKLLFMELLQWILRLFYFLALAELSELSLYRSLCTYCRYFSRINSYKWIC